MTSACLLWYRHRAPFALYVRSNLDSLSRFTSIYSGYPSSSQSFEKGRTLRVVLTGVSASIGTSVLRPLGQD